MTHPSTDFPDALDPVSVIQAIERNLADWYRALTAYVPGAAVCEEADHIRVVCPASHPVCNAVLWAHFGRGHSDERIRRIVANFQDRGVPGLWWIGPSSRPVDLNRHLIAAGLESMDTLHGMAAG
ncbi:MAG: hypothetical protein FJX72_02920, partial [Armatimonadetes bacterium]|nr:hypothetical protein [Armatimonadota bacterium]